MTEYTGGVLFDDALKLLTLRRASIKNKEEKAEEAKKRTKKAEERRTLAQTKARENAKKKVPSKEKKSESESKSESDENAKKQESEHEDEAGDGGNSEEKEASSAGIEEISEKNGFDKHVQSGNRRTIINKKIEKAMEGKERTKKAQERRTPPAQTKARENAKKKVPSKEKKSESESDENAKKQESEHEDEAGDGGNSDEEEASSVVFEEISEKNPSDKCVQSGNRRDVSNLPLRQGGLRKVAAVLPVSGPVTPVPNARVLRKRAPLNDERNDSRPEKRQRKE